MNFSRFYQDGQVWKEDDTVYIVSDGKTDIYVETEWHIDRATTCYKVISHKLEKEQAEKIFDLVEEHIKDTEKEPEQYEKPYYWHDDLR